MVGAVTPSFSAIPSASCSGRCGLQSTFTPGHARGWVAFLRPGCHGMQFPWKAGVSPVPSTVPSSDRLVQQHEVDVLGYNFTEALLPHAVPLSSPCPNCRHKTCSATPHGVIVRSHSYRPPANTRTVLSLAVETAPPTTPVTQVESSRGFHQALSQPSPSLPRHEPMRDTWPAAITWRFRA